MKLDLKSPYMLSLYAVKLTGYSFFSINTQTFEFYRDRFDYALMVGSLTFSVLVFYFGKSQNLSLNIKSMILNIATLVLFFMSMTSVLLIKVLNIFGGKKVFKVLKDLMFVDTQVTTIQLLITIESL